MPKVHILWVADLDAEPEILVASLDEAKVQEVREKILAYDLTEPVYPKRDAAGFLDSDAIDQWAKARIEWVQNAPYPAAIHMHMILTALELL